jgi:hypothetical protein
MDTAQVQSVGVVDQLGGVCVEARPDRLFEGVERQIGP